VRVLLTGGTGFIGANLARRLLADGHDVHLLVRPGYHSWRIAGIAGDVRIHEAALEDRDRVLSTVRAARPDQVFHLGVYGAYPHQADASRILAVNLIGTINLADACRQTDCAVLVNTGTSSEYGRRDRAPREDELPEPNTFYALSKSASTLFCGFAARTSRMRIPTLRLYSVYGPFEEPSRLIPRLLVQALAGTWPPLVSPDVAHDYVFIDDVCDAYLTVSRAALDDPGAVFNVGTGVQTTIREVVDVVGELLPVAEPPVWGSMPNRPWDTTVWIADPARLRALGWTPRRSLRDGLEATLRWLQDTPDRIELYRARASE
jgi:dolichol-phosphate mannosyltransferase